MRTTSSKSGFTLLEMLVASLLLGMLVTILTMVFNSSAIAWRTGKAGVAQLSKVRRHLSFSQYRADNLLPRINVNSPADCGIVVSPWCPKSVNGKHLRTRAVQKARMDSLGLQGTPSFQNFASDASSLQAFPWAKLSMNENLRLGNASSCTVGVLSLGPDGVKDTDDDISTWPDKVE